MKIKITKSLRRKAIKRLVAKYSVKVYGDTDTFWRIVGPEQWKMQRLQAYWEDRLFDLDHGTDIAEWVSED